MIHAHTPSVDIGFLTCPVPFQNGCFKLSVAKKWCRVSGKVIAISGPTRAFASNQLNLKTYLQIQ
jgi:hypothetical protein